MARKISFEDTAVEEQGSVESRTSRATQSRPLLGMKPEARPLGALGSMARSLGSLTEKAKRADEIEEQLVQGQAVIELDPTLVDGAFVADRMASDEAEFAAFRETIEKSGQNSPILVRPHPQSQGRYEVAFGHRRLRAVRDLGRKVKAVVRPLSDEELVVAQGQENSARSDLTYIERARFAARLEERGFSREVIMSALNVDKAALSKLIAIATRIPLGVIEAVGPAPGFGRPRWSELADLLEGEAARVRASAFVQESAFLSQPSDKRFLQLHDAMKVKATRARAEAWTASDGTRAARIQRNGKKLSLLFDERVAPEFGDYVRGQLQNLFDDYKKKARAEQDKT